MPVYTYVYNRQYFRGHIIHIYITHNVEESI